MTPKTGSFRFASIGDPQLTTGSQDSTSNLFSSDKTTAQGWLDTMEKVGLANVNFIAGVGDQVDLTGNGSEAEYRNFFAPQELRSIPWAPSVGNHDRHYPFLYHYNLPNEQTFEKLQGAEYGNATNAQYADVEAAGNYWYRYNNTLFVVLNTSAYPTSTAAAEPIITRFDDTLTAAKAASPGYAWLFVQHHKSTASVADHCADLDIQYYVEVGFEELMTTHGVDFVLSGHDHVYARSYPLTGKKGGTPSVPDTTQGGSAITNPNGTIYVTMTTGSGLKYYDLFNQSGNLYVKDNAAYPYLVGGEAGSEMYAGFNILNYNNAAAAALVPGAITDPELWTKEEGVLPVSNAMYLQSKKPSFTVVDVEGNIVTFKTYEIDNTSTSIDTFTVTK
jgi:3',5'-cyclic AMP phosphodiesterase CpdA